MKIREKYQVLGMSDCVHKIDLRERMNPIEQAGYKLFTKHQCRVNLWRDEIDLYFKVPYSWFGFPCEHMYRSRYMDKYPYPVPEKVLDKMIGLKDLITKFVWVQIESIVYILAVVQEGTQANVYQVAKLRGKESKFNCKHEPVGYLM